MRRTRVIPVLLIHKGGIYKTINFKNATYIGDPINAIRIFNDMEVDEIAVIDIDASKEGREPNYKFIQELATEAFMPFAYGGGIRSLIQAKKIFQSGVEKIIINSSARTDPEFIRLLSKTFGSQSIVVCIDYVKKILTGYRLYDHVASKSISTNLLDAAILYTHDGAGEILLNSVDRDGTLNGLDIDAITMVSSHVELPIIACGGAANLEHMQAAEIAGASAIAAGSMFIFHGRQKGILINYPSEKDLRNYLS